MANRIFTFKSGYTIGVRPEFNAMLVEVMIAGWEEDNPQPEPPLKEVKVKGGTRQLPLHNDPEHLQDLATWNELRNDYRNAVTMKLAFDTASINQELLRSERERIVALGGKAQSDDLQFYLSLVCDYGNGKPGDADYRPNEMEELARFAAGEKGPSGALIEHLLKSRFQDNVLPA